MLTIDQKETILRKSGVAVPEFPSGHPRSKARDPDASDSLAPSGKRSASESRRAAIEQWAATIDALYVEYVARRAAKSLRDAEDARQLSMLRLAGERSDT
jgi:hypothetical protein